MQHVHTLRVDMHRLSVDDPVVVAGGMGHDASTSHTDVLVAELRGSRDRSHEMCERVERIDSTTQHTDTLVEDIHNHLIGREGTD